MSDKSPVSEQPLLPDSSAELPENRPQENAQSDLPPEDSQTLVAENTQKQSEETAEAAAPAASEPASMAAPATETSTDTPDELYDPLYPYPPEDYTAVGANEYVSDMDKIEEEPVAEAGGGDGGGTDDTDEVDEAEDDAETPGAALSLTDHFRELRNRLVKIFLGIIVGFLICWGFSNFLADILYLPLVRVLPADGSVPSSIIFTGIAEGFFTHMKLAIVAGIFVVSPFIFYQIWSFIAPGLYDTEKKFIVPVAICSAICFILGGCFCYFVVFPNAFKFFMTYSKGPFKAMPSMKEYFGFTMQLILAFGMVFELPLFTFFLARMGLITSNAMRRFRRYFIVLSFILAAVLTPPDIISQLLMAAPMLVLYEASIFIAAFFGKREPKKDADGDEEEDDEEETNDAADVKP